MSRLFPQLYKALRGRRVFAALSVFQYCYNSSPKKNKNIMASFSDGRFAVFVVPGGHAQQLMSGPGLLC